MNETQLIHCCQSCPNNELPDDICHNDQPDNTCPKFLKYYENKKIADEIIRYFQNDIAYDRRKTIDVIIMSAIIDALYEFGKIPNVETLQIIQEWIEEE